ncbi:MAG: GAF domain-containing protein [Acidobacteriota bacterium]|nr:MAG: GAF domain-containing protein [Acidobacteriota bacterium]
MADESKKKTAATAPQLQGGEPQSDLLKKGEKFLEIYNMGKQFTEEVLRENEKLRYKVASLESRVQSGGGDVPEEVSHLQKKLERAEDEKKLLESKYREVESENKDFARRYLEIEEQNNNLANLYVASYQLHSTLDFQEVVQIVMEIIINLIGAEEFALMLLDEKTNELSVVAHESMENYPRTSISIGKGIIGTVARTGEPYYINQDPKHCDVGYEHPLVCIPLKIKEHVIGVITLYKLLVQKDSFSAVDYELFTLLAGHAATALFSSKLYSQSERKLSTIQGFLDLLTTTSDEKGEE